MRTPEQIVAGEVLCCMSSIVHTLAHCGQDSQTIKTERHVTQTSRQAERDLGAMLEQAFELACPIDDWEEAAIQAGWRNHGYIPEGPEANWRHEGEHDGFSFESAEDVCSEFGIEPYASEVYEHWAVTDWFADKLIEAGEKVDKDFAGLCVWARTTTGQAIYADGVIERIAAAHCDWVKP